MVAEHLDSKEYQIEEGLGAISAAKSNFDVFKQLKAAGIAYGLPNFLVAMSPGTDRHHFTRRVILTNWNPELLALLVEANNWGQSDAAAEMYRSIVPVAVRLSDLIRDGDEEGKSNLRAMIDHGIDQKAYFPMQVADGLRGAISFSGTRDPINRKRCLRPTWFQFDGVKFHGRSSSIRLFG